MQFRRYAIYYTPDPGPLAQFGGSWLGWDPVEGRSITHPPTLGLPRTIKALTDVPRKYGLHGTLKPPFFMKNGKTVKTLQDAIETLAAEAAPVWIDALKLAYIGGFVGLVPLGDQSSLVELAARVVMELDDFRAPPSETELARRREKEMSPAQESMLAQWGYPYVLDEFQFHMTLTGDLTKSEADQVLSALHPIVDPLLPIPFLVTSLTLLGEDQQGLFHEIQRYSLTG
ncbi:MAG: DUF1045 domain-containing protein [Pseudoruegeria sp.]